MSRYALCCAALVLALAAVVAFNGFGTFYTDIKPEVYLAPWDTLVRYASSWSSTPYLGFANFNVGLIPVLLPVGILRSIGLSPEWAFKVLHFALWLIAAWGINRLVRLLVPTVSRYGALAAGVAYIANPYQQQAGSTLAILLPMALLPWLLITFVRALRERGWRWPAAFGLVFFAMSGMNVAIVPVLQLLSLIPVLLVARLVWNLRSIDLARETAKCAAFVIGLSLYWLVPARSGLTTGRQVVLQSETLDGIAKVSSFTEVLRGLGMWPLYGTDAAGPWVPQYAVFLASTWVMLLTMLWPSLSALALRWLPRDVRMMVVGWVAIAVVVMVGMFPGPGREASPFGHLVTLIMQNPAASAFRTTNKVGAVLALGFAVALGIGAECLAKAVRDRPALPPIAFALVCVTVLAWVLPSFTGRLYTSPMDVPQYWYKAAEAADQGNPHSRVLLLPGQVRPTYRWTQQRPDDLPNSLLKREAVLPETTPNASAPGGNYLAALNDTIQSGILSPATVSTYTRYLGVDKILVRHDTVWEQDGGARPASVDRIMSVDPGLFGEANFGAPGEFVFGPGTDAHIHGEGLMHPVQLYSVRDRTTALRATSDSRSIVVAGDGWSLAQLVANGQLAGRPSFRYASDLTPSTFEDQLGGRHSMVLTDTNARRAAIPNRLSNGEGSLLTAEESAPNMRSLGAADDQTIAVRSGATVTASTRGGTFFDLPFAAPENILDGDEATSWLFGDFGRAVGQHAVIRQPTPVRLGVVRIKQAELGSARIDKVSVSAGGRTITQSVPDKGYASFDFGDITSDSLRITVNSTRGKGYNMVGIADVRMPGASAIRTARTPLTFSTLYAGLNAEQRKKFATTPLDVSLARYQGTTSLTDDAEKVFRRLVTLPDAREFDPSAMVRTTGGVEAAYDDVAGYSRAVRATSSDFYFHNADARAAMAADGRSDTAWVPGGRTDGSWWQIVGAERSISSVTIEQAPGFGSDDNTEWAGWATVTVDGKTVATQQKLREDGRTTIRFSQVRGKTVRVTFKAAIGRRDGPPARFLTIDTGLRMRQDQAGPLEGAGGSSARCLTVATVDGQPLRMRPATRTLAAENELGTRWVGCGPLKLGAGEHRIEQADGFVLDSMSLSDRAKRSSGRSTDPVTKISKDTPTAKAMTVRAGGPFNIVLGQSYDARWKATANGRDLGAPTVIDGYSTGWRVPDSGRYDIDIRFAPQRLSNVAAGLSAMILLLALGLCAAGLRKRKLAEPEASASLVESQESTVERAGDDKDNPQASQRSGATAVDTGQRSVLSGLRRPVWEIGAVLVAGFAVGVPGLVAAIAVVALMRLRPVSPHHLLAVGAAVIFVSMPVYLVAIGDKRGSVSADAVAFSLWPHYLAGAGFVVVLMGALLLRDDQESTNSDGEPEGRGESPA